jgi:hypothetical protein
MSAGREPDQPDLLGAVSPEAANLGSQRQQRLGVSHTQRVAKHAGPDAKTVQPANDRLTLVPDMLSVATTR